LIALKASTVVPSASRIMRRLAVYIAKPHRRWEAETQRVVSPDL
jgi:hypothetical protein